MIARDFLQQNRSIDESHWPIFCRVGISIRYSARGLLAARYLQLQLRMIGDGPMFRARVAPLVSSLAEN
jgi:hypothetical protein